MSFKAWLRRILTYNKASDVPNGKKIHIYLRYVDILLEGEVVMHG